MSASFSSGNQKKKKGQYILGLTDSSKYIKVLPERSDLLRGPSKRQEKKRLIDQINLRYFSLFIWKSCLPVISNI